MSKVKGLAKIQEISEHVKSGTKNLDKNVKELVKVSTDIFKAIGKNVRSGAPQVHQHDHGGGHKRLRRHRRHEN